MSNNNLIRESAISTLEARGQYKLITTLAINECNNRGLDPEAFPTDEELEAVLADMYEEEDTDSLFFVLTSAMDWKQIFMEIFKYMMEETRHE